MSIDSMTNYEKREVFATKILPRLPFAILVDNKRYGIKIEKGRIAYKCGETIYIEKVGKDNYEAGNKMLEWIRKHNCPRQSKMN